MAATRPVRERDLHAYLDGELPPRRVAAVEAHLRDSPADARRLQAYRADGEAIARIFTRVAPLPAALRRSSDCGGVPSRAGAVAADRRPMADEKADADERASDPIGL